MLIGLLRIYLNDIILKIKRYKILKMKDELERLRVEYEMKSEYYRRYILESIEWCNSVDNI